MSGDRLGGGILLFHFEFLIPNQKKKVKKWWKRKNVELNQSLDQQSESESEESKGKSPFLLDCFLLSCWFESERNFFGEYRAESVRHVFWLFLRKMLCAARRSQLWMPDKQRKGSEKVIHLSTRARPTKVMNGRIRSRPNKNLIFFVYVDLEIFPNFRRKSYPR